MKLGTIEIKITDTGTLIVRTRDKEKTELTFSVEEGDYEVVMGTSPTPEELRAAGQMLIDAGQKLEQGKERG